jgi:hypothetical protein
MHPLSYDELLGVLLVGVLLVPPVCVSLLLVVWVELAGRSPWNPYFLPRLFLAWRRPCVPAIGDDLLVVGCAPCREVQRASEREVVHVFYPKAVSSCTSGAAGFGNPLASTRV